MNLHIQALIRKAILINNHKKEMIAGIQLIQLIVRNTPIKIQQEGMIMEIQRMINIFDRPHESIKY